MLVDCNWHWKQMAERSVFLQEDHSKVNKQLKPSTDSELFPEKTFQQRLRKGFLLIFRGSPERPWCIFRVVTVQRKTAGHSRLCWMSVLKREIFKFQLKSSDWFSHIRFHLFWMSSSLYRLRQTLINTLINVTVHTSVCIHWSMYTLWQFLANSSQRLSVASPSFLTQSPRIEVLYSGADVVL